MSALDKKSTWHFALPSSLLLGLALLVPLTILGAEHVAPQPESSVPDAQQTAPQPVSSVPGDQQKDRFEVMQAPRNYLSTKIARFAGYIDRFFGGDRHFQETNQSVLRLNLTRVSGYGGDGNYQLAARLNLKLPATEGRFRLLIETDPEENVIDQQAKAPAAPANKVISSGNTKVTSSGSVALAVRYEKKEESPWYYNTDAGIKFRGLSAAPNPFVRARGSYSIPVAEWRLKAAESVFWFNTLGVGETTQLDLDRILNASLLFRASSNATWLHDKKNFDLRQNLTFFHTLDDRAALQYQASVIGISNPQLQVTDYVVQVLYRYRLNREWLYFELSPQLHFPKEKNYKSSPTLSMRLEMLFDESR